MIGTNQFKNGLAIKLDDIPYLIVEFQHVKPGKGGAFVRTKLKNLKNGAVIERTFRSGEKVEDVYLEEKKLLFSYRDHDFYHFFDESTYEQTIIDSHLLGDSVNFLRENTQVTTLICDGKIIGVNVPNFVELKIAYTEPGFKGDTAQGGYKTAKLETGLEVQVPLFLNTGDMVRIDTRTKAYMGRV